MCAVGEGGGGLQGGKKRGKLYGNCEEIVEYCKKNWTSIPPGAIGENLCFCKKKKMIISILIFYVTSKAFLRKKILALSVQVQVI